MLSLNLSDFRISGIERFYTFDQQCPRRFKTFDVNSIQSADIEHILKSLQRELFAYQKTGESKVYVSHKSAVIIKETANSPSANNKTVSPSEDSTTDVSSLEITEVDEETYNKIAKLLEKVLTGQNEKIKEKEATHHHQGAEIKVLQQQKPVEGTDPKTTARSEMTSKRQETVASTKRASSKSDENKDAVLEEKRLEEKKEKEKGILQKEILKTEIKREAVKHDTLKTEQSKK